MKRLVLLTLLALASIVIYINLGSPTGADTRKVPSLPAIEQKAFCSYHHCHRTTANR